MYTNLAHDRPTTTRSITNRLRPVALGCVGVAALAVALLLATTRAADASGNSSTSDEAAKSSTPTRQHSVEREFLRLINRERTLEGRAPLVVDPSLEAGTRAWTATMARKDLLAHAAIPTIRAQAPRGHTKLGENVGRGATAASLFAAFMASPTHRAVVLDPSYTLIGVSVFKQPSTGQLYTTHRFAQVRAG